MTAPRIDVSPAPPPPAAPFVRDRASIACYVLLALLMSSSGMIGPLLPALSSELGLSYQQGAYHSVALAIGVTGAASFAPVLQGRLGRRGCILAAVVCMSLGLVLLCAARHLAVSLAGGVALGVATALSVLVAPAVLASRHGPNVGNATAEANLVAYLGLLAVPGVVGLAVATVGWRWSFVLPVVVYVLYWLMVRDIDFGAVKQTARAGSGVRLPGAYWCFWAVLTLGVCAELTVVVWGASYLEGARGLNRDDAIYASMVFPVGMFAGRFFGVFLMRRFGAAALALPALALAAAGAALLLSTTGLFAGLAALFVCGLGMATLYPLAITLALLSAPGAADAAAGRASLASGVATLTAPFIVGALADRVGIAAAFGVIPGFLLLAAVAFLAGRRLRLDHAAF